MWYFLWLYELIFNKTWKNFVWAHLGRLLPKKNPPQKIFLEKLTETLFWTNEVKVLWNDIRVFIHFSACSFVRSFHPEPLAEIFWYFGENYTDFWYYFLLHVEHRVLQAEMYCRYIWKKLLAVVFNKGIALNIEGPRKRVFFKKIETR